jgi:hypothetical protein
VVEDDLGGRGCYIHQGNLQQKNKDCKVGIDEILMYKNKIYVPNYLELKVLILREIHDVPYAWNPGYQKTITTIKRQYYWPSMKKEIVEYIAKC